MVREDFEPYQIRKFPETAMICLALHLLPYYWIVLMRGCLTEH